MSRPLQNAGRRVPVGRVTRLVAAAIRRLLLAYVRAKPRSGDPRRVTILSASAWGRGGTTRVVLELAGYLAGRYDVEIISVWRQRDEPFAEFPDGVEVIALDDHRPEGTPSGPRGLPQRLLRRLPSVLVHSKERYAAAFSLLTDIRLVRLLRRRSGVLITTRPGLNLIAAQMSLPGLVKVGQEHMNADRHAAALREAMPSAYLGLDAFTVLTEGTRREYDFMLRGQVPVVRIPNPVRMLPGPGADLSAKTILAAGRLTRQKGFDMLIPAFAQVAARHGDWRLRICGEGRLREDLEALINQHGLAGAVTLAGQVEEMGTEMAAASIYVLSSRFEGFPLVLLEAMSKGMAVVGFDCPTGPADLIDQGRNGLLVPDGDVDALARQLLALVEDEELRRRCGAAAAATAEDYRIEVVGPLWEEFLEELTSRTPSQRSSS